MKKQFIFILLIISGLILIFFGFKDTYETTVNDESETISSNNIGNVLMIVLGNENNEDPFSKMLINGIEMVDNEFDIEYNVIFENSIEEYRKKLIYNTKNGEYDIILCVYYDDIDIIKHIYKENPQQRYIMIDKDLDLKYKNTTSVVFKEQEACFLGGFIAAKLSQNDTIGFIGGHRGITMNRFENGYKAGAKKANNEINIILEYANSYYDQEIGKNIASNMYREADVIFPACGQTGFGVIEEAKSKDKLVIGVDTDLSYLAPRNLPFSIIKRVDLAIYNILKDYNEGYWYGGGRVEYGLSKNIMDIKFNDDFFNDESIIQEAERIRLDIIAGNILPPYDPESYSEYLEDLENNQ